MMTELTFIVPNRFAYQEQYYQYSYEYTTSLKSRTGFIRNLLRNGKLNITWKCEDQNLLFTLNRVQRAFKSPNLKGLKEDMLILYSGFLSSKDNKILLARHFANKECNKIAAEMVDKGLVLIDTVYQQLNWNKPKMSWMGSIEAEDINKWRTNDNTAPIAPMTYLFQFEPSFADYYTSQGPTNVYLGVFPAMVQYYLEYVKKVKLTTLENIEGLTIFDGSDIIAQQHALQQLLITGQLKLGKNKLTQTGIKKCREMTDLRPFPTSAEDAPSRIGLVLNALYNIYVNDFLEFELPKTPLTSQEFFTKISYVLEDPLVRDFHYFLGSDIKLNIQVLLTAHQKTTTGLYEEIFRLLKHMCQNMHNKWVEMQSFIDTVNLNLAKQELFYILPGTEKKKKNIPKDANGKYIDPSDYKKLLHDKIIDGYIKTLAACGFINLLFDDKGNIAGLQPTELAAWQAGLIDNFPTVKKTEEDVDVFLVNDMTGIILVKEPTHPYAGLINEFAEKLGNNRWVITSASLLKGCSNTADFKAKIDRYKTFIEANPKGVIKQQIERILKDSNAVQRTAGASGYHLYDIDPKNKVLHQIIATNPEITQYTLKVEGCRLLIKNSFLSTFISILRAHGYLADINV
ncbi:MAG: hypothetical protein NC217_04115 [Muribaculaceae bacterium]|nr:hypothetical protein [Muribaculaceae bacterium]